MQLYFHEIMHAVMGELFSDHFFFRYTRPNWPIWFDEGIAEYFGSFDVHEGNLEVAADNPAKVAYLLNAMETGTLVPLAELLSAPPERFSGEEMNIYYAASWGLVSFLVEHPRHRAGLGTFLARLRSEEDGLSAFARSFTGDLAGLDAEFRAWLAGLQTKSRPDMALFDGETIDDWTVHEGGRWDVLAGEIYAVGDDNYNYLIKSELPRDAFVLEMDVRVDAGTVGVILGNNFHGEYPYYYLVDLSASRVSLRRSYSPVRIETIEAASLDTSASAWVALEIEVTGDRLKVRVDREEVIDVAEDRNQYSLFGLYLYKAEARFRDIALSTPRASAAALPAHVH
jgi:hypothetical protein